MTQAERIAQHTAGPWRVLGRNSDGNVLVGNNDIAVTIVGWGREDDPEAAANTRLIAAAPRLLAAAKAVWTVESNGPTELTSVEAWTELIDAIEQAEGHTS
jgi:hypothetical protein